MSVSVEQFIDIIQDDQVIIVDTRSSEAILEGYIPNAIHAPKHQLGKLIAMGLLNLDSPIALVCDKGAEDETEMVFNKLGFKNIKAVLERCIVDARL